MASNAAIEGASGAMGGIIALLATYPLMTVRTLFLVNEHPSQAKHRPAYPLILVMLSNNLCERPCI